MLPLATTLVLLLTGFGHATNIQQEVTPSQSDKVQELIQWMESSGGFLDPRVEIRRWNPDDPTSYFGVFANAPIKGDEVLMHIPDKIKMQLIDDDEGDGNGESYEYSVCGLSWMLQDEFEEEDESDYLPYINYLKTQARGQLPATWSPVGQYLLLKVQGDLPMTDAFGKTDPEAMVEWLEYIHELCVEDGDTLDPHFIALAVQRGFDSALIPVYGMINHGNVENVNTITKSSTFDQEGFKVYALRDLQAGDELYFSYHGCPDCDDRTNQWGTPEMLRDFGFVEGYPQRFHVLDDITIFVDEVATEDGGKGYIGSCLDDNCPDQSWVEEQVSRLANVEERLFEKAKSVVPEQEYTIIRDYHKALLVAFSAVWSRCPESSISMSARSTTV